MYLDFFKLQKMPFRLAPDPAFLYWSAGHSAALTRLRATLARRGGSVSLIGNKGVGKSMLLEYLADECGEHPPIRISIPPPSIEALTTILAPTETQQAARAPVVLCDNAHLFTSQLLSSLLRRTQGEQGARPLSVVLAGEPDLAAVLAAPAVSRVSGGHSEPCQLPPLSSDEVIAYVGHRLAVAGLPDSKIFGGPICAEIHRETRGNPRLMNALCDAAMAIACERELPRVGVAEIRRGLEDIAALSRVHESQARSTQRAPPEEAIAPVHEVPATAMPPSAALGRLQVIHAGRVLQERELAHGILRVGRGVDNDLRIDSQYISRYHCRVVTNLSMSLLEDVRSTNGLFVNDRRVRNHRLRAGDVIQLGEHELRYADYRTEKDNSG